MERVFVGNSFGDVPKGLFLVRGDTVVMICEIDPAKEAAMEANMVRVPTSEIEAAFKADSEAREKRNRIRRQIAVDRGLSVDVAWVDDLLD